MPYIIMRRTDIPNGVLQVDDLKPNDSQRNYIIDPPGQSGYVRNIPNNNAVQTSGAGPILTIRDACGVSSYLIDNVEDSSGTAITAAVANFAGAFIINRLQNGLELTLADVDQELFNAGATAGTGLEAGSSTGQLSELLSVVSGAKYQLPAGSQVEDGANAFDPTRSGAFADDPAVRRILDTGAFRVSLGGGDLSGYLNANFEAYGAMGAAVVVLNDDGSLA